MSQAAEDTDERPAARRKIVACRRLVLPGHKVFCYILSGLQHFVDDHESLKDVPDSIS